MNAEALGPGRIEGMLGVDEGCDAAGFLGVADDVQGERGFAAGFWAKDFDHSSARNAVTAEREIEAKAAGRDAVDDGGFVAVESHDGAFAELFFNLLDGAIKRRIARGVLRRDGNRLHYWNVGRVFRILARVLFEGLWHVRLLFSPGVFVSRRVVSGGKPRDLNPWASFGQKPYVVAWSN